MKKQFLFNILLLIILNALIKPFWVFGIDRTIQNTVGSEAYGLYFALFNFSILFNAFLDLGIVNFNNRSIAQSPTLIQTQFPRLVLLKVLLGLVYMVICLGTAFILGYHSIAVQLLGILSVNQFLASFLLFLRSNISGLQMYVTDSILSVVDRFLMIVLCSILLWTNLFNAEINIVTFALLQTIAYLTTCFIVMIILLRKSGFVSFKGVPFFSGELFRKSMPFALLGFLMVIYNRIDAVLLERLLPNGAMAAGIYAQSYRILDAINMISVLIASLLLPMFARLLSEKAEIKPLVKLSFSILLSGTIILVVALTYFAVPIFYGLYHAIEPGASAVFVVLLFCVIPVSVTYIFGTLLTADGRLFNLNVIAGVALILNLSLNLLLIPRFQIIGAAVSAFITQVFVAVAQIFICKKRYSLNFSWIKLLPFVLLVFFSILFSFLFDQFQINVLLKLMLSLLFSFLVIFLLKIIDFQEISTQIKSETAQ